MRLNVFKTGDKIKVKLSVLEQDLEPYKNTQVYPKLIEAAQKYTFEVIGENNMDYSLKRIEDGTEFNISKSQAAIQFALMDT